MNAVRRQKLLKILLTLSILSVAMALVMYALRERIDLFYTPTQVLSGESKNHTHFRLGGMVVAHTVVNNPDSPTIQFDVTDFKQTLHVVYRGALPALFREGQGVVMDGHLLDKTHFRAKMVLAKHDENYRPPLLEGIQKGHPHVA